MVTMGYISSALDYMMIGPEGRPRPPVRLRSANKQDLYDVARVYLRAFPDTLSYLKSPKLSALAVADVMRAPLLADPGSIILAHAPAGEVVGYVIAVTDASVIAHTALLRGLFLTWLARWLRGLYHLSPPGAAALLRDKLRLRQAWRMGDTEIPSRLLSIAVPPEWQGQGIGTRLLEAAFQRLRELGRTRVRLEVRPENASAHRLYGKMGFSTVGEFVDRRGRWLVLVANTDVH